MTSVLLSVHNKGLILAATAKMGQSEAVTSGTRSYPWAPANGGDHDASGLGNRCGDRGAPGIPPVSCRRANRQASHELNSLSPLCQIFIFSFVWQISHPHLLPKPLWLRPPSVPLLKTQHHQSFMLAATPGHSHPLMWNDDLCLGFFLLCEIILICFFAVSQTQ